MIQLYIVANLAELVIFHWEETPETLHHILLLHQFLSPFHHLPEEIYQFLSLRKPSF